MEGMYELVHGSFLNKQRRQFAHTIYIYIELDAAFSDLDEIYDWKYTVNPL